MALSPHDQGALETLLAFATTPDAPLPVAEARRTAEALVQQVPGHPEAARWLHAHPAP